MPCSNHSPQKSLPAHPRDLYPAEQVVLGATRLSMAAHRNGADPKIMLDRYFAYTGARAAAASHGAVMRNLVIASRRMPVILETAAERFSPDEESLVHAVAYAQRGWDRFAAEMLGQWLPPAAVRLTLPALQGLAGALADRRLCLPLRPWHVSSGTNVSYWQTEIMAPTSTMLH